MMCLKVCYKNLKQLYIIIVTVILFLLLNCRPGVSKDELVARVGNSHLNRDMLIQRMGWEGMGQEKENDFVERWINRELLFQEAKRLGLDRSEELEWELELVEKEFLIQKLLERTYAQNIQVTEQEIISFYEKNKQMYQVEEDEIKALHILTKTRDEANLAYQEIQAGRNFEDVAKEKSVGIFGKVGGNMNVIKKSDVIPEISRVVFRLPEGSVTPVISSNYGFHILKVVKKWTQNSVKSIDDVRSDILQQIRVDKERTVYFDLLFQLQNKTNVYVAVPQNQNIGADSILIDRE